MIIIRKLVKLFGILGTSILITIFLLRFTITLITLPFILTGELSIIILLDFLSILIMILCYIHNNL